MSAKMCSGCFNPQFCVHKLSQTVFILLAVSSTLAGYERWPSVAEHQQQQEVVVNAPIFDMAPSSRGLSVLVGQTALLPCVVRNLGDKVVSWIRKRDLHILTSGIHVFTSDSRFQVVYSAESDFWGLRIRRTQTLDTGKYECQVNTDPKMNFAMLLTVTDAHMRDSPIAGETSIEGPSEQYVRVGATITFVCVASRTTAVATSRAQLKWTHAARDVTFQSSRGGISVDTDYRDERITSRLTVAMVTPADAGNYTCHGADVSAATVTLAVVEGEHTEAMQRDPPNEAAPTHNSLLPFFFVYFNWILR